MSFEQCQRMKSACMKKSHALFHCPVDFFLPCGKVIFANESRYAENRIRGRDKAGGTFSRLKTFFEKVERGLFHSFKINGAQSVLCLIPELPA